MCRASASDIEQPSLPATSSGVAQQPPILQSLLTKTPPADRRRLLHHKSGETRPTGCLSTAVAEAVSIAGVAFPMVLAGILLYSRSMVSMLFLGSLGELQLAGGALAIGFANITGYSILSGLAMGMEPICGQAFGAGRHALLGLSLQRTVLLLLAASLPIAALWLSVKSLLLLCGQDEGIATAAQSYILFSLPDLAAQSLLHPIRIYLRAQSITLPLSGCALLALLLHFPVDYLLVSVLGLGIRGVALGSALSNITLVAFLLIYISLSGVYKKTWDGISLECLTGWGSLLHLAIPSCISVCLEWWWYEIMVMLCGLLLNPRAAVASMGILIQITSLIYIFPSSLSIGVSTRVGNELGAGRPERAKLAAVVGLACSFFLGLSALVFAVMVRKSWAWMFTKDAEILRLTSAVLPIIGLCELGNCPQTTMCGVLRGTARPRVGANINLGSFYLVGMPVAVAIGFWFGFDFTGLWLGLFSAQASCVFLMLLALARTNWNLEAERAKQLTGAAGPEEEDGPKSKPQNLDSKPAV